MVTFRTLRTLLLGLTAAAALAASGCLQQSVNPLFLLDDSTFDDRLLGSWTCGDEQWNFAREVDSDLPGKPFYRIQIQAGNRRGVLGAMLGRIGADDFVTFLPLGDDGDDTSTDFVGRHTMGVYTFGRLVLDGSRMRLAMLGSDWIEHAYSAGLLPIGVIQQWTLESAADPTVILTAPPAGLQRFARTYARDEAVFSEQIELVRTTDTHPSEPAGQCYSNH